MTFYGLFLSTAFIVLAETEICNNLGRLQKSLNFDIHEAMVNIINTILPKPRTRLS